MSSEPNDKRTQQFASSASAAGAIQFGDNAQVGGDVVTGGKQVINTGGGSYYAGDISTGGGAFIARADFGDAPPETNLEAAFARLRAAIDVASLPDVDRQDLRTELRGLQDEVLRGPQANADQLLRHLRYIGRLQPDVFNQVIDTLTDKQLAASDTVVKVAESQRGTFAR